MTHLRRSTVSVDGNIVSGSSWIMAGFVTQAVTGLAFWVIAARTYGTDEVGTAAALFSSVQFINYAMNLGLQEMLSRPHLVDRRRHGALWTIAVSAAVVAWMVGGALYLFVVDPTGIDELEEFGFATIVFGLWRARQDGTAPPPAPGTGATPIPQVAYESYEDIWRAKWRWDSVAKGTHIVNCWYQRGCNWNVYVKDGIVWREEQSGTYEPIDPKIPDYNPRGCNKGACYSERMYDGGRTRHPLKRVGERGEGKWQRVSWDEGLTEVADRIIDVLISDGPGAITWNPGTANSGGCNGIGTLRAAQLLDTPVL